MSMGAIRADGAIGDRRFYAGMAIAILVSQPLRLLAAARAVNRTTLDRSSS